MSPVPLKRAAAQKTAGIKKGKAETSLKGKTGGKKTVKKSPVKKIPAYKLKRYKCRSAGISTHRSAGNRTTVLPGTAFEDLPEDYVCPVCGYQGKGKIGKWGFDEWVPTRYICAICGYIYDEKRGEPHNGIKPGTKFEDLPDDYKCPV